MIANETIAPIETAQPIQSIIPDFAPEIPIEIAHGHQKSAPDYAA